MGREGTVRKEEESPSSENTGYIGTRTSEGNKVPRKQNVRMCSCSRSDPAFACM
jgi:hypothetical protein